MKWCLLPTNVEQYSLLELYKHLLSSTEIFVLTKGMLARCSQKVLQRPAEERAGTGRNQPSATAAGGLRLRQLALIMSENGQSHVPGREAYSCKGKVLEAKRVIPPNHPQTKPLPVHSVVGLLQKELDSTTRNRHARCSL